MANDVKALLAICDEVVADADLRPEYSADGILLKTFCNIGARRIAKALGCQAFEAPGVEENADFLHEVMEKNVGGFWYKTDRAAAAAHAADGGLAFASMTGAQLGEHHGHICAVRPEPMKVSTSAGGVFVPIVANVGRGDQSKPLAEIRAGLWTRPNWNCRESEAFPVKRVGAPNYYIWRPA